MGRTDWLRIIVYYLVAIAFWAIWCIPPLMNHDHSAFQSAGTIIIAAAILRIGLDRARFERYVSNYRRNALVSAVERLEAHREINEKRLNFTFDLHMLQISRISKAIKVPNPNGPESDNEIADLDDSIKDRIRKFGQVFSVEEDARLAQDIERLNREAPKLERWRAHTYYIELLFLVLGTLQTGYGAAWSEFFEQVRFQ